MAEDQERGEEIPGGATVERHADGSVTVVQADPVIRVSVELLRQLAHHEAWAWDGETLQLDSAGTHRYRRRGPDPDNPTQVQIFERI